jgi:signal transduction histidine kinase
LHNVVKHAQAETATVVVAPTSGVLELTVIDQGAGFDTTAEHRGQLGLSTMRERAQAIGAELKVHSAPGTGTTVRVSLPCGRPGPGRGQADAG